MDYYHSDRPTSGLTSAASTSWRPRLVGRSHEIQRLTAGLASAAGGRGRSIFLLGESGIGKTHLACEALELARQRGFLTLKGQAYTLERSLAYAPVLDALGPFLRRLDPARQTRLTSGLPELGRLFADLRLPQAQLLGDAALEKTRLFEAVSRLLERMTDEQPIALFVDDLHWADQASVELLHYIARGLGGKRMLLLAAYRADNLFSAHHLAPLVMSLRRAGLCEEVSVGRLETGAAAELARNMLRTEPPAELLSLLSVRAAGIPLFVTALIRALLEGKHLVRTGETWVLSPGAAATVPLDVRDLILERLDLLDNAERLVLDLIAVGGEAVSHSLLRETAGLDDELLVETLRRLCGVALVTEEREGLDVCYRVAHPLTQEVAYAAMPEMARRRAHATYAAALEKARHDDPSGVSARLLERLARHYSHAGREVDRSRALEVLLAAGDQARQIFANDQAATYYGTALALIRDGAHAQLLAPTLEKLGEVWERVGEVGAAIVVWNEALAMRERVSDSAATMKLRRLLAMAEWDRGGFDAAQAHLAAGIALLRESSAGQGLSRELADLLDARALILGRLADATGMAATAAELLEAAERCGSPRAAAQARLALAEVKSSCNEHAAAREDILRALTLAEAAAEPLLVCRAHNRLMAAECMLSTPLRARGHGLASIELARRLGAPPLELYPQSILAVLEFLAGDWRAALDRSAQTANLARRLAVSRGIAYAVGFRAILLAWSGQPAEAEACIAEVRAVFLNERTIDRPTHLLDLAEAAVARQRGDYIRAVEILALIPLVSTDPPMRLFKLALLGEAQAALGLVDGALATARELLALSSSDASYPAAVGAFVEGLARAAGGDSSTALSALAGAADLFDALGMPFEHARARLEWAGVAYAVDPAAVVAAVEDSLVVFERLGARRHIDRSRALLRRLGVRGAVSRRRRTATGPLSHRQMEVALLVAQGLTNAEIAARLVLSHRTVTTHLEHIYTRLGLSSRQALIQYVAQADGHLSTDQHT